MEVGPLADHAAEPRISGGVLHLGDEPRQVVVVDEFGVAEDFGRLSEEVLDFLGMHVHLLGELLPVVKPAEGVEIGLTDELAAARLGEFAEQIDDVGAEAFHLVKHGAGDGIRDPKLALMTPHQVEDHAGGGAVALVGHLAADLAVLGIVEVKRVVVEDAVATQAVRLVNLKVVAD